MANGFTNRLALRMSRGNSIEDVNRSLDDVEKWSRNLPFSMCGFHFVSGSNGANIPNSGSQVFTYDTTLQNRESFANPATGSIQVPKGKAGLYFVQAGLQLTAAVSTTNFFYAIQVNGSGAQGTGDVFIAPRNRLIIQSLLVVNEQDILTTYGINVTGGNANSTAYAGDPNTPQLPFFKGWRIALLPDSVTH